MEERGVEWLGARLKVLSSRGLRHRVSVGVHTSVGSYTAIAMSVKESLTQLCKVRGDPSSEASSQVDASPSNRKEVRLRIPR